MLVKNLMLCLLVMSSAAMTNAEDTPNQWYGQVADRQLMSIAPKTGFVADGETWSKLWSKWNPGEELPEVEFGQELVVVATVTGPNRMFGKEKVDENGNLTFVAGSTRMAGPGFAYLMRRVSRDGVKTVNGNEVPAAEASMDAEKDDSDTESTQSAGDSITMNIVGTLATGVMAIGGETTGTTITANAITLELDFGGNTKLEKIAAGLNGQRAVAAGPLRRESGVESGPRWIVAVTKLSGATEPAE